MKAFSIILFLHVFLLAGLGSRAAPSVPPPVAHHSETSSVGSANSTQEFSRTAHSEPFEAAHAVSPEPSLPDSTESPNPGLPVTVPHPESPETPRLNSLNNSVSDSLEIPQMNSPKTNYSEPSETPKSNLPKISQTESANTPQSNSTSAETPSHDPAQTQHPQSPQVPKLNSTEISDVEVPDTPSSDPTTTLYPEAPEMHNPDTTETPSSESPQTLFPDPTEAPHLEFHVTQEPSHSETTQTEVPKTHSQGATETPVVSSHETTASLHPDTPAPLKEEALALNDSLRPKAHAPGAPEPDSLHLLTDPPAILDMTAPQNMSSKGSDVPPPSIRITNPPLPSETPNTPVPATPKSPQRRNRGERVNTIIVVERVEETGVTLVGRPRGAAGGALCLFLAGTGLLIGILLLLWCLYRRASRHRPFAHHRLPNDGDEPVMHLDAPKDPYDLYFYTPDAWIPSHITTKQPPSTPPLPPKLPPPPRGGRPQRLEPLSPATLPNNFV